MQGSQFEITCYQMSDGSECILVEVFQASLRLVFVSLGEEKVTPTPSFNQQQSSRHILWVFDN